MDGWHKLDSKRLSLLKCGFEEVLQRMKEDRSIPDTVQCRWQCKLSMPQGTVQQI